MNSEKVKVKSEKSKEKNQELGSLKVAIVHDFLTQIGGAEKILETFVEIFPKADIYMMLYDMKIVDKLLPNKKINTSFLQNYPFCPRKYKYYLPLMPKATESYNLDSYNLVLSITSAFAKGVKTNKNTIHICYLNTPTRYLWESSDYYLKTTIPKLLSPIIKPIIKWIIFPYLKRWDLIASQRPNYIIANSQTIYKRTKKFYHRTPDAVIYPYVDIQKYSHYPSKPDNYYLLAGRLVPYKRNDIVIEAFNKLRLPLKIIGTGYDKDRLMKLNTSPYTTFLGRVSDEELINVYKNCRAYIFPALEDFGITPIEAMSAGRPVIAFGEGGATETIVDKKTGIFFDKQTPEDVIKAVKKFNQISFEPHKIQEHALQFSKERFKKEIITFIKKSI